MLNTCLILSTEAHREILSELLEAPLPLLGTVHAKGERHAENIRQRGDSEVTVLTKDNRDSIPENVAQRIRELCGL